MRLRTIVATGLLLAACQPSYDRLEIEAAGELSWSLDPGEPIRVTEGAARAIRVTPIASGSRNYEPYHLAELRSNDERVVTVDGGPEVDVFVLIGLRPGRATLDVSIRGRRVDEIPCEVTEQDRTEEHPTDEGED